MSLSRQLDTYLSSIYNTVPDVDVDHVVAQLLDSMCLSDSASQPGDHNNLWSEQDIALITYGDTIVSGKEPPLVVLSRFLDKWVGDAITWLHILPFFPWTSDDGFAVMDYSSVNQALGTWEDIVEGREGQYRIRIMDNHVRGDCAYPAVLQQADGTIVTITYGHWTPGESPWIACRRMTMKDLDQRFEKLRKE